MDNELHHTLGDLEVLVARLLAVVVPALLFATTFATDAHATMVTYKVDSSFSAPGFAASYLHSADGCNNGGLYMCSGANGTKERITSGTITGNLVGGVLSGLSGVLKTANHTLNISGGSLGGDFSTPWQIITNSPYGTFSFVDLSAKFGATNQPNSFNGSNFVLWGQNFAAGSPPANNRWGLDVYAYQVTVPEPGTLGLMLLGLVGLGLVRRQRAA